MPTFRVYYEYVSTDGVFVSGNHVTSLNTPDDARKATNATFKSLASSGIVVIKKIKRVRT